MPIMMMMSRGIRRVPFAWKHPRNECGFIPLHAGPFEEPVDWDEQDGPPPTREEWMPEFAEDATMGICMYEEVTEGTPISLVYPDTEQGRNAMSKELSAQTGVITDGMTAQQWRQIIDGGLGMLDVRTGLVEIHR